MATKIACGNHDMSWNRAGPPWLGSQDGREKLWRVDKSANATVYERQMWVRLSVPSATALSRHSVGSPLLVVISRFSSGFPCHSVS